MGFSSSGNNMLLAGMGRGVINPRFRGGNNYGECGCVRGGNLTGFFFRSGYYVGGEADAVAVRIFCIAKGSISVTYPGCPLKSAHSVAGIVPSKKQFGSAKNSVNHPSITPPSPKRESRKHNAFYDCVWSRCSFPLNARCDPA